MNISDTAVGLGRTFPVVDRVEEATKALVSTKSIDLSLSTYQSSAKVKSTIWNYVETLNDFEKNWINNIKKGYNGSMSWKSDGVVHTLTTQQYIKDNKILEVVIPNDYPLNSDIRKALDDVVSDAQAKFKITISIIAL